MQIIPQSTKI